MEITFRLEHFEGPLDLLLHLISKNKVNIYDIPIAEILEQYMTILHHAQSVDMEVAGDFIAMAAQLVYIKSRMLLPVHEDEETEDPRAQLVEMLLEYQRIKKVTPYFREQINKARDLFVKAPEPRNRIRAEQYHYSLQELVRAARGMLRKAQRRLPPPIHSFTGIIGYELAPVSEKITMILHKFLGHTHLHLNRLFDDAHNRSEIVATFLAVLELSKTRRVRISTDDTDTTLTLTEPEKEDA